MRLSTPAGATLGALFLALASCQLVTGSFDVDGNSDAGAGPGSLGTNCADVAACCKSLTGAQATQCSAEVQDTMRKLTSG